MSGKFQAGGTLREGSLYVTRAADEELPAALLEGEFCYVLAPRQIGKSSLRVRTAQRLSTQGVRCAAVDLTAIGSKEVSTDAWYFGLLQEVAQHLALPDDPVDFWERNARMSPVHRWSRFLREEVLGKTADPVVIFIDEIDAVRSLPFSGDDFFASVRGLYNQRADDRVYERLTFCLLGVAMPGELIQDETRTPFNIGRGIFLEDFTPAEAEVLLGGFPGAEAERRALLRAVLFWTDGHPYMTQRVCEALAERGSGTPGDEEARARAVVEEILLQRGRVLDANLAYADKCFARKEAGARTDRMLRLYERLRAGEAVRADGYDAVQMALRLTGMAAERKDGAGLWLRVRNRVFATVFDEAWVRAKKSRRLLDAQLAQWLGAGRSDDFVLRGQALTEALDYSADAGDVSPEEHQFLLAGAEVKRREEQERREAEIARERRERLETQTRVQRRALLLLGGALSLALVSMVYAWRRSEQAERDRDEAAHATQVGRGARALLLSGLQRGDVEALNMGLLAVAPSLRRGEAPPAQAVEGLAAAALAGGYPTVVLSGPPEEEMIAAAFSPDGARVLTASHGQAARVWDAATGERLLTLTEQAGVLTDATYSPDGAWVATASADRQARVYNAKSGVLVQAWKDFNVVLSVAFSPDSARVLTASAERRARVYERGTGKLLLEIADHEGPVRAAAFSPDGALISTVCDDGAVRVFDGKSGRLLLAQKDLGRPLAATFSPSSALLGVATDRTEAPVLDVKSGKVLLRLKDHNGPVRALAFSPDGALIATASQDGAARVFDGRSGWLLSTLRGHFGPLVRLAFSPDGMRVATASEDHTARVFDARTGRLLSTFHEHLGPVRSVAFSPDGRLVVSASDDATARVFTASPGGHLALFGGLLDPIEQAALSPDGARLLLRSRQGGVRIVDAASQKELVRLAGPGASAAFSADGKSVVVSGGDRAARVLSAQNGALVATLTGHQAPVTDAALSPDGKRVVTASEDRSARVFDAKSGRLLTTLAGHGSAVTSAAFSPDGRWILTTEDDYTARVWEAESGQPAFSPIKGALALAFAPDGSALCYGASKDSYARVRALPGGKELLRLSGHFAAVVAVAFSPDGATLVTGSEDQTARVWGVEDGQRLFTLVGHSAPVRSVAFSPDGKRVVTASDDQTVRVWERGEPLFTLFGPADAVRSAVFFPKGPDGPDGARVLLTSQDGTARTYPAALPAFLRTACGLLRYQPDAAAKVADVCAPYLSPAHAPL